MDGRIIDKEDDGMGKSCFTQADLDLSSWKEISGKLEGGKNYGLMLAVRYGIIRGLARGILALEGARAADDQALFACICIRHPGYELHWETLEGLRLLYHGVLNEGKELGAERWNLLKLGLEVCTLTLISESKKLR